MTIKINMNNQLNNDSKIKALCNVKIDNIIAIKGVMLIEGSNGHFISMPNYVDKNGKCHRKADRIHY